MSDIFNGLSEEEIAAYSATPSEEPHIVVGPNRVVTVPESLKRIGVQYDHNIETVTFDCPRYWDGHDMSKMVVYINYLTPNGDTGSFVAKNVTVDENDISIMHFDWTISKHVTSTNGNVAFLVCVKNTNDDGLEINHWNSELNRDLYISEGLEVGGEDIQEDYPDVITQILLRLNSVEEGYLKAAYLSNSEIDSMDVIWKSLRNGCSVAMYYNNDGYTHAPFAEGVIFTNDSSMFGGAGLGGLVPLSQVAISSDGNIYTRIIGSAMDDEVYDPVNSNWTVASGGGTEGGSSIGFKKIGFTEDCDYVATSSDGYSAFAAALNEAVDGDTIMVMPGVYKGNSQYLITKNLNFIGIGKPEIDFPVVIQGGGEINYENWEWVEIYPSITSKWDGVKFIKGFFVRSMNRMDEEVRHGTATLTDCDVMSSANIIGTFTRCNFDVETVEIGHYYGMGTDSTLTDCNISVSRNFQSDAGYNKYKRCNIYLGNDANFYITAYSESNLVGCKIFTPSETLWIEDSHSSGQVYLGDTLVFTDGVYSSYDIIGGYLIKGESLAGGH